MILPAHGPYEPGAARIALAMAVSASPTPAARRTATGWRCSRKSRSATNRPGRGGHNVAEPAAATDVARVGPSGSRRPDSEFARSRTGNFITTANRNSRPLQPIAAAGSKKAAGGSDQSKRRGRPRGSRNKLPAPPWSDARRAKFAATIAARRVTTPRESPLDKWDELVAAGLCECLRPLEGHPPLPRPLPLGHGRPCDRNLKFPSGSSAGLGGRVVKERRPRVLPAGWQTPGWVVDARRAAS